MYTQRVCHITQHTRLPLAGQFSPCYSSLSQFSKKLSETVAAKLLQTGCTSYRQTRASKHCEMYKNYKQKSICRNIKGICRQRDRPLQSAQCHWRRECCCAWTGCVCAAAARAPVTEVCHVALPPFRQWRHHAVRWRHSTSGRHSVAVASSNSSRRRRRPMWQGHQMSAAVSRPRADLCWTGDFLLQFRFQRLYETRHHHHHQQQQQQCVIKTLIRQSRKIGSKIYIVPLITNVADQTSKSSVKITTCKRTANNIFMLLR